MKSSSTNAGDFIVRRAIERELTRIGCRPEDVTRSSTWMQPDNETIRHIRLAKAALVCGTNLLSFHPMRRRQFAIGINGLLGYRDLVVFGAGWSHDRHSANFYGGIVSRLIFSKDHLHSVRDSQTLDKMKTLGVANCINTSCPTMWELTEAAQRAIPRKPGKGAIITLTDYRKDPKADSFLLDSVLKKYGKTNTWLFLQGASDLAYAKELSYSGNLIDGNIDRLLEFYTTRSELDYIGTRLHCGILALEHGIRTIIIEVDNRAREISHDTGLPTCRRTDRGNLNRFLEEGSETILKMPWDAISRFRTSLENQLKG